MSIITLTTDYGNKDYFVSSLKAKLISNIDITNIVDISHEISPFNLTEAGYVLEGAFNNFPKGTIHLVMVGSSPQEGGEYICLKSNGQYFLGTNNGLITSVLREEKITGARTLDIRGINSDDEKEILADYGGKEDALIKKAKTKDEKALDALADLRNLEMQKTKDLRELNRKTEDFDDALDQSIEDIEALFDKKDRKAFDKAIEAENEIQKKLREAHTKAVDKLKKD